MRASVSRRRAISRSNAQVASKISAVNTAFSGDAYANQLQVNDSGSGNPGAYFDDVRVWDSTGSTQNAPIGASLEDSRLITKLPSGAGALTQFSGECRVGRDTGRVGHPVTVEVERSEWGVSPHFVTRGG